MTSLQHLQFACIRAIVNTRLYVGRSSWWSPATQPDLIKSYGGRTDLYSSRVFMPREAVGQAKVLFPLVICVHGGGFIVNNPSIDDPLARQLADNSRCIVVSIDYRKAPQAKFPRAYEDVVEQSLAAMDDPDLPLDRKQVVFCGSSAGGNLILAAAQHPHLRGRLAGVMALYPLCDGAPSYKSKMAQRPDPSVPDFLESSYTGVFGLYLDESQDFSLTDVRLSPTNFISRDHLPSNMLLIGCEHDLLCHEAEEMAKRLAGADYANRVGTEAGWRGKGVQWHMVKDQPHAFEHFPAKAADKEMARKAAWDATWSMMCHWIKDVFATNGTNSDSAVP